MMNYIIQWFHYLARTCSSCFVTFWTITSVYGTVTRTTHRMSPPANRAWLLHFCLTVFSWTLHTITSIHFKNTSTIFLPYIRYYIAHYKYRNRFFSCENFMFIRRLMNHYLTFTLQYFKLNTTNRTLTKSNWKQLALK